MQYNAMQCNVMQYNAMYIIVSCHFRRGIWMHVLTWLVVICVTNAIWRVKRDTRISALHARLRSRQFTGKLSSGP